MTNPNPPKPDAATSTDGKPSSAPEPAPRKDGGMIDEGGPTGGNIEGVESETETRRDGGMLGEA